MSAPSFLSLIFTSLLQILLCFTTPTSAAHRQHIFKPSAAHSSARPLASASGYTYIGCWNETTGFKSNGGARALEGGKTLSNPKMTIPACLTFCSNPYSKPSQQQPMQYAALTSPRTCHCGAHLSLLSDKLPEAGDALKCTYACDGNASQICGGEGALTLYNLTITEGVEGDVEVETGRAGWNLGSGAEGAVYGVLGVVGLVVAAVL